MFIAALGFIMVTAGMTAMCHAVGDGHVLHAFLYVLCAYVVIALIGGGVVLIGYGLS